MKTLFLLTTLLVTFNCESQIVTNEFKTVLVTNWVKLGEFLRVVNGHLYNTAYSKLWGDLWKLSYSRRLPYSNYNPWHTLTCSVEVNQIGVKGIACDVYEIEYQPETYTGAPELVSKTFIKNIIVYHYPDSESLVTGQVISGDGQKRPCRCMKVENYFYNGNSYEAYDCGIQSTNLVPVITETKIRIGDTNSVLVKP